MFAQSGAGCREEQARQLTEEVNLLRERLERQLGAAADTARGDGVRPMLDQLEDRAAEIEADNHALRQRITRLETELSESADTLDAARAMNRELMNQLNRDTSATTSAPANPPRRRTRTSGSESV